MKPGEFLDAAGALAGDLPPVARDAIAAAWPADAPHPAVVAHLLAVMLAAVRAEVSSGFIRAQSHRAVLPPKAPSPSLGLAAELGGEASASPEARLSGERR